MANFIFERIITEIAHVEADTLEEALEMVNEDMMSDDIVLLDSKGEWEEVKP